MSYFETARLLIRKYEASDWLDLYEMLSDSEVVENSLSEPLNLEQTRLELNARIKSNEYLAVELKSEHKLIGNIHLSKKPYRSMELGYTFNKRYWKNNYAFEAISEVLNNLLATYRIHRIYARSNHNNTNSTHLLERLGFKLEGYFPEAFYTKLDENNQPIWQDLVVYSLLNKNVEN